MSEQQRERAFKPFFCAALKDQEGEVTSSETDSSDAEAVKETIEKVNEENPLHQLAIFS